MLNNVKSKKILSLILEPLKKRKKLNSLKHNKFLLKRLNINHKDFEGLQLLKKWNKKFNLKMKDIEDI